MMSKSKNLDWIRQKVSKLDTAWARFEHLSLNEKRQLMLFRKFKDIADKDHEKKREENMIRRVSLLGNSSTFIQIEQAKLNAAKEKESDSDNDDEESEKGRNQTSRSVDNLIASE